MSTLLVMNRVFWSVVTLDALLFIGLFVASLGASNHDGGRDMGIFFFIVVPVVILGMAVLLHVFTESVVWHVLALIVVAGPGLVLVYSQARDLYIDRVIAQNRSGAGYFSDSPMRAMAVAVVQRDLPAMRKLGRVVNVNIVGGGDVTLLSLAVERAFERDWPPANAKPLPASAGSHLEVVQTLLDLGAKPGPGIDGALKLAEPDILRLLLKAGGDPNTIASNEQPVVFRWLRSMSVETLRVLIDHGLDLNTTDRGDPLAVVVTIGQRWDLLALLIERGADISKPRPDGRNVAGELAGQVKEATEAGHAVPPDLLRARALAAARLPAWPAPEAGQRAAYRSARVLMMRETRP